MPHTAGPNFIRLRLKLSIVVVFAISAVMGLFGYVAIDHLKRTATEEAVRQLSSSNRLIRDLIATSLEGMRIAVGKLGETFQTRLVGDFEWDQHRPIERDGVSLPRLLLNGRTLNSDSRMVDVFSRESGGNVATIFVRSGDDFYRISTSVLTENGDRAVGTRLERSHPAYSSLVAGKTYRGPVRLFGTHYMTEYRPITDRSGTVIGVLFVGMDLTATLESLRRTLRQFTFDATGYMTVVDAEHGPTLGQLVVHPAREGQLPLADSTDSTARQAVELTLRKRNGVIFYDWTDEVAGKPRVRSKVAVMDEYHELNWIVLSTAYLDEITQAAIAGKRYVIVATIIAALVLIVVLNLSIGRLILLPMLREIRERIRVENQLRVTNSELQAFTYAASHDIKAPLGRLNSFSGLLEQRYRGRLDEEGLFFVDMIRSNAVRLMALVEDLLAHAEIEQKVLECQSVCIRQTVAAVLSEKEVELNEAGAEVQVDLPQVLVHANPLGLGQVLRNLLENSLKYSGSTPYPIIEIGAQVKEGKCCLWVRDNGQGFDMAYHEKIFEVFRRLHTYEDIPGSGIGLALVKKAMERMGGRVWADSQPGKGSTFFLELRIANAEELVPA